MADLTTLERDVATLKERVTALEHEQAQQKTHTPTDDAPEAAPWWQKIWGTFKDDPDYEEAMRLGREYRESLRPQNDEEVA